MANKDDIIAELRLTVERQAKRIERMERRFDEQAATLAKLESNLLNTKLKLAKAQKDSSNSSKLPSSDIVKPPKNKPGKRKKRKQGARKGHEQRRDFSVISRDARRT